MEYRLTRRVALAVAAVVLAALIAPAGFANAVSEAPSVTPGARTTVTWMKHGSPSGIESRRDLLFKQFPALGDKYALEAVIAGKSATDVNQKLRLSLAAGAEIADLVMLQYPVMKEFVLSGVLVLYEGGMNLLGLDKGDANMADKFSGRRCASDV